MERIIQYILENKQWIFSGIGVLLLTGLVSLVKYLRYWKPDTPPIESNLQSIIDAPMQSSLQLTPQSDTFVLSPAEVFKAFNSTPLLQQPDLISHYTGVKLCFEGELNSAQKVKEDRVRIAVISTKVKGGAIFEIDPTKYKGIGLLKTGHKMSVVGAITDLSSHVIHLENVDLNF